MFVCCLWADRGRHDSQIKRDAGTMLKCDVLPVYIVNWCSHVFQICLKWITTSVKGFLIVEMIPSSRASIEYETAFGCSFAVGNEEQQPKPRRVIGRVLRRICEVWCQQGHKNEQGVDCTYGIVSLTHQTCPKSKLFYLTIAHLVVIFVSHVHLEWVHTCIKGMGHEKEEKILSINIYSHR